MRRRKRLTTEFRLQKCLHCVETSFGFLSKFVEIWSTIGTKELRIRKLGQIHFFHQQIVNKFQSSFCRHAFWLPFWAPKSLKILTNAHKGKQILEWLRREGRAMVGRTKVKQPISVAITKRMSGRFNLRSVVSNYIQQMTICSRFLSQASTDHSRKAHPRP